MAVLLSDDWQAYGFLSVIFSGAGVAGAGGANGDGIWLFRGFGVPVGTGPGASVWAGLYHHGAGYS